MQWNRPSLPDENKVQTTGIGISLIVLGILGIVLAFAILQASEPLEYSQYTRRQIGGDDYGVVGAIMLWISVGLTSLGLVLACVGAILAEIRCLAFEAAVRAGEVEMHQSTLQND